MIVDSSVWVEAFSHELSEKSSVLVNALHSGQMLWITLQIYQEVLQGAKDAAQYMRLQQQMSSLPCWKSDDDANLHAQAAMLYARGRWQGITIRSPNDCLIAAAALEAKMPVLTLDKDFTAIARIEPKLKLV